MQYSLNKNPEINSVAVKPTWNKDRFENILVVEANKDALYSRYVTMGDIFLELENIKNDVEKDSGPLTHIDLVLH